MLQEEKKVIVAAVSYLNTKPLVYDFENGAMSHLLEFTFDYPANVASMLIKGQVDLGLVPVAIIPQLADSYIISDYCIGASKPVASVCLFSEVPMHEIQQIILDYQSRTSVALLKVLVKEHWKIHPEFVNADHDFENNIKGTTAGLIIGDRALIHREKTAYVYDLAEEWQCMTGLPFVFAVWLANKKLSADFVSSFNRCLKNGLDNIDTLVATTPFPYYDLSVYYKNNIDYLLDDSKREGLKLFLEKIKTID